VTEILLQSLRQDVQILWEMLPRLTAGLIALLVLLWMGRVLGRNLARLVRHGRRVQTYDRFVEHLVAWIFGLVGLTLALQLAGLGRIAVGMLAAGGVLAIVFGFAFREIGENLLAGFFLSFSRSFEVGDLVQSGEWTGDVRKIELRQVHIRTADGSDIFIPSAQIYRNALVNFTKDGLRSPSFTLGIDYADDAAEACRLLQQTTRGTRGVLAEPPATALISALAPNWVEITVSFWSDTFQEGLELVNVTSDVMESCRRALREAGFTLSNEIPSKQAVRSVQMRDRHVGGGEHAAPSQTNPS
jgi:small-conductance mechanosensitive channel